MAVTTAAARNSTDGYTTPNPEVYNAVADPENHEQSTEGLSKKEVPRHDRYAMEVTGEQPERVEPYTATGANPSYPEDALPGVGGLDVDVPIEAVQTPEEGWDDSEGVTVQAPTEQATESVAVEAPAEAPAEPVVEAGALSTPSGNASGEEWRAFAISQGMSPEEADSMSRDELRSRYGG